MHARWHISVRFSLFIAVAVGLSAGSCSKDHVSGPRVGGCPRVARTYASFDTYPTWSPGDTAIAYFHAPRDTTDSIAIFVAPLEGRAPYKLLAITDPWAAELTWSPDGSRIAMYYQFNVWTLDVATRALRQWTDRAPFVSGPAWSPDGRYLIYETSRLSGEPDSAGGLHLISMVDGTQRALLHGAGLPTYAKTTARFSPDGHQIVLSTTTDNGYTLELFLVGVDGSDYRQLTHLGGSALDPQWSADGLRILFDFTPAPCYPEGAENRTTWVINADGSSPRQWPVTLGDVSVQFGFPCALSPSGASAAFTALDSTRTVGVLWTSALDGTRRYQLTTAY